MVNKLAWAFSLSLFAFGCHSGGPYGHSIEYAPLDEEETAVEGALEYDPVMAAREPRKWSAEKVMLFGIVERRKKSQGADVELSLSLRTLSSRNLCDEGGEDTCRVTVSDHEYGKIVAHVRLSPDDDIGMQRVAINSLLRVVGKLKFDGQTPTSIEASYYRHFPRNEYVTTAARSYMQR
jgi:hypothetical protein